MANASGPATSWHRPGHLRPPGATRRSRPSWRTRASGPEKSAPCSSETYATRRSLSSVRPIPTARSSPPRPNSTVRFPAARAARPGPARVPARHRSAARQRLDPRRQRPAWDKTAWQLWRVDRWAPACRRGRTRIGAAAVRAPPQLRIIAPADRQQPLHVATNSDTRSLYSCRPTRT